MEANFNQIENIGFDTVNKYVGIYKQKFKSLKLQMSSPLICYEPGLENKNR